jgi:hypothetical protein
MEAVISVIDPANKQLYSASVSMGLLQYNYTDKQFIIAYSNKEDALPTLINYLLRNGIALVSDIPQFTGMYCVREDNDVFKVYLVYFDKESDIFINEYQYSLSWLLIQPYNLYTQYDPKLIEQIKQRTEETLSKLSV